MSLIGPYELNEWFHVRITPGMCQLSTSVNAHPHLHVVFKHHTVPESEDFVLCADGLSTSSSHFIHYLLWRSGPWADCITCINFSTAPRPQEWPCECVAVASPISPVRSKVIEIRIFGCLTQPPVHTHPSKMSSSCSACASPGRQSVLSNERVQDIAGHPSVGCLLDVPWSLQKHTEVGRGRFLPYLLCGCCSGIGRGPALGVSPIHRPA